MKLTFVGNYNCYNQLVTEHFVVQFGLSIILVIINKTHSRFAVV